MAIYKGDKNNNTITGSIGADFIYGYEGNDKLIGLAGNDYIDGGNGDDALQGGEGDDKLIGGNGVDFVDYTNVSNSISVNLITGKAIGQGVDVLNSIEDIYTGVFDDTLVGNANANWLNGNNGSDKLFGLNGNDRIYGGNDAKDGNDILHGGNGDDTLLGGGENDTIFGDDGNDILDGGASFDFFNRNLLFGGKGNDTIFGGSGNDWLDGEDGDDVLDDSTVGFFSTSTLKGGNGKDVVKGGFAKDTIILTETIAATDTVVINQFDSQLKIFNPFLGKEVNSKDTVIDFSLGNGETTTGIDQIDLQAINIAENSSGVDGANIGSIRSHAVNNGIISFDDANTSSALNITAQNLPWVFKYLQNNFGSGETFAFTANSNTYLYQDDGDFHRADIIDNDMVVQLNGITATNLNTDGMASGGIWLV